MSLHLPKHKSREWACNDTGTAKTVSSCMHMEPHCLVQQNWTHIYCISGRYPLFCFYLKHVSETGFCFHLQMEPIQLGPINRDSPYHHHRLFNLKTEHVLPFRADICIALFCSIQICFSNITVPSHGLCIQRKRDPVTSERS